MSDLFDQASAIEAMDRELRIQAVQSAVRANAGAAIDADCDDCGEAIEADRRAAQPDAKRCVPCQQARERRKRLFR